MSSCLLTIQEWRYFFLLCAILALLVIQPIAAAFGVMESLFELLFVVVMASFVLVLANERVWRLVAVAILISVVALLVLGNYVLSSSARDLSVAAGHALGAAFFVLVAGKIVYTILKGQEVNRDTLCGAICGYLLLGVAWALTYSMMYATNRESFQIGDAIQAQMEQADYSRNVFIYYSFITLTTVGYGDLTPLSMPARTLSWVEALTGQLYLAVLIASLISTLVAKNISERSHR
jgi:voltage-gated potassium channel